MVMAAEVRRRRWSLSFPPYRRRAGFSSRFSSCPQARLVAGDSPASEGAVADCQLSGRSGAPRRKGLRSSPSSSPSRNNWRPQRGCGRSSAHADQAAANPFTTALLSAPPGHRDGRDKTPRWIQAKFCLSLAIALEQARVRVGWPPRSDGGHSEAPGNLDRRHHLLLRWRRPGIVKRFRAHSRLPAGDLGADQRPGGWAWRTKRTLRLAAMGISARNTIGPTLIAAV